MVKKIKIGDLVRIESKISYFHKNLGICLKINKTFIKLIVPKFTLTPMYFDFNEVEKIGE